LFIEQYDMSRKSETIFGIHAVKHLLEHNSDKVLNLWVLESRAGSKELSEIVNISKKEGIVIELVNKNTLDKHSNHGVHQGVLAKIRIFEDWSEKDLPEIIENCDKSPPLILILDGVQDPHNLGACVRTANAAGVEAVVLPRDKTVSITSTVRKVASGAIESTPVIYVTNLSRTMKFLKEQGFWLVGTDGSSTQQIYDIDLKSPIAIVMGSEGKGLRKNTKEQCDYIVSLPMHGIVESLNLSVASGVCLYEVLRQREQG
jgi:23S rRNA (guanosine2251-2'-O)-methyltransferase